jgi:RNA-directed DNA polymerase
MTMAKAIGAVSSEATEWYAIDWHTIHRNVRRLQVRIAQATKVGRWGKARALQRLLTHSYSGKVLAVRRVTENNGKKTPGVDKEIWDTPEKKTQAVVISENSIRVTLLMCSRKESVPWKEWRFSDASQSANTSQR